MKKSTVIWIAVIIAANVGIEIVETIQRKKAREKALANFREKFLLGPSK